MRKLCLSLVLMMLSITLCYGQNLSNVRTKAVKGTVALTFDDGPSPIYTPQVLDILKKNNIKATFFVMGWSAKKYPQLIHRMLAEGHAVANHTMSHKMLTKLSANRLRYEVVQSRNNIAAVVGSPPVCLRPPYGASNSRVREFIRSQDMIPVSMGFNSFDYENRGTQKLINWVVKNAHSGQVILLHDGYKGRAQTVKALPEIIAGIRKKGLGFSAICYPQGSTRQASQ